MTGRSAVDGRDHLGGRLRTLEECALHKRTVRATCPSCGRVRVFDAVALWWLFKKRGWDQQVPGAVRVRLRCEACGDGGSRIRPRLEITREQPTGPQPPFPTSSEWRRIVSRYRS